MTDLATADTERPPPPFEQVDAPLSSWGFLDEEHRDGVLWMRHESGRRWRGMNWVQAQIRESERG